MRIGLLCFLLWGAAVVGARAQAPTETEVLRQADNLLLRRKYESAFRLLQAFDSTHRRPNVALKAADIALHYHLRQRNFRRFSFRNLTLTEVLDSARRQAPAELPYAFEVGAVLDSLHHRQPASYRVAKALADYYFELQQCACNDEELNEDELFRRMVRLYQAAHRHGHGDYRSYYALGYALMRLGEFAPSAQAYERALVLRPTYALAHFQLAYDYLELQRLPAARDEARRAVALFQEPQLRLDAEFLLAELERRLAPRAKPAAAVVAPEKLQLPVVLADSLLLELSPLVATLRVPLPLPLDSLAVLPDSAVVAVPLLLPRPVALPALPPPIPLPDSVEVNPGRPLLPAAPLPTRPGSPVVPPAPAPALPPTGRRTHVDGQPAG